jgi:Flp pilus assembly pilin Flp
MRHLLMKLWNDDEGALIATEWVFVVTILVIGLVAGLKSVQQAVLNELEEVASAVGSLSQSYSFAGTRGCCRGTGTSGSNFRDSVNHYSVETCVESGDEFGRFCPD